MGSLEIVTNVTYEQSLCDSLLGIKPGKELVEWGGDQGVDHRVLASLGILSYPDFFLDVAAG